MEILSKFKKFFFTTTFSLILVTNINANPVCNRMGAITECGEGKLSNLHIAGKATLKGTTVLGDTQWRTNRYH